jgi:hypothetical protein
VKLAQSGFRLASLVGSAAMQASLSSQAGPFELVPAGGHTSSAWLWGRGSRPWIHGGREIGGGGIEQGDWRDLAAGSGTTTTAGNGEGRGGSGEHGGD